MEKVEEIAFRKKEGEGGKEEEGYGKEREGEVSFIFLPYLPNFGGMMFIK